MAFGVLFADFALRRIPHEWNLITVPGFLRISCVLVLLICQFVANGDDSMKGRQAAVAFGWSHIWHLQRSRRSNIL
jgi:hypothetical protein